MQSVEGQFGKSQEAKDCLTDIVLRDRSERLPLWRSRVQRLFWSPLWFAHLLSGPDCLATLGRTAQRAVEADSHTGSRR